MCTGSGEWETEPPVLQAQHILIIMWGPLPHLLITFFAMFFPSLDNQGPLGCRSSKGILMDFWEVPAGFQLGHTEG